MGNACRMGGKSSSGDGGKTVADGIKGVHATESIGDATQDGDEEIGAPKIVGSGAHARVEFAEFQSCGFGRKEFLFADAECRQEGEGEEDDSHTSHPVGDAAPEQDGVGQDIDVDESCGACGGESRHSFKEGLCGAVHVSAKEKGEHAQDAVDNPHDGDDEKTISTLKVCGTFSPQESQKQAQCGADADGDKPCAVVRFAIADANEPTNEEQQGFETDES